MQRLSRKVKFYSCAICGKLVEGDVKNYPFCKRHRIIINDEILKGGLKVVMFFLWGLAFGLGVYGSPFTILAFLACIGVGGLIHHV